MFNRLAILISISAILISHAAFAQSENRSERLAVARAYIAVTQSTVSIPDIVATSTAPLLAGIKQRQPTLFAEKGPALRILAEEIITKAARESLVGQDQVLANIFTTSEIKALQIFSQSPIGRRVLDKMPQYTAALQPGLQKSMRKYLPELLTRLQNEGVKLGGK